MFNDAPVSSLHCFWVLMGFAELGTSAASSTVHTANLYVQVLVLGVWFHFMHICCRFRAHMQAAKRNASLQTCVRNKGSVTGVFHVEPLGGS